ncbi:FAD-dependent monooxygenase [Streptomyces sp. NPDC004610]|uniref:FAD binding domain-containing protein n=1 Tax=unclassified Streptomyces TaxID=2593676 RepID=UPI0033A94E8A
MEPSRTARTVIVGGSLGGLAAAHELASVGAEVAVYERSAGNTRARGAGIVMQPEVEDLLGRMGVTARQVSVELWERQQLHLHGEPDRYAMPQQMTSWDTLYRTLRAPLEGVCHRRDSALRRVTVEGAAVTAEFGDGYTTQGNFLVGADGIGSATRRLLDPATRPSYSGYVAWRGLEPESALPGDLRDLLSGRFTVFGTEGQQLLCYLVPGADGELSEGARRVNWVWYTNVSERSLPRLLTGRSGRTHSTFLPPGEILPETDKELLATAEVTLPAQLTALIEASEVFMQPVYDLPPFRMVADHAALIGDAAGTVRPHTASGTSKAFGDAAGLATALRDWTPSRPLPAERLAQWEENRLIELLTLAEAGMDLAARSQLGTPGGRRFFTGA